MCGKAKISSGSGSLDVLMLDAYKMCVCVVVLLSDVWTSE